MNTVPSVNTDTLLVDRVLGTSFVVVKGVYDNLPMLGSLLNDVATFDADLGIATEFITNSVESMTDGLASMNSSVGLVNQMVSIATSRANAANASYLATENSRAATEQYEFLTQAHKVEAANAATSSEASRQASLAIASNIATLVSQAQVYSLIAENAAGNVLSVTNIFTDEPTGRAAVEDDATFIAIGQTPGTSVEIWRRVDANSSILLKSEPTKQYVDEQVGGASVASVKMDQISSDAVEEQRMIHLTPCLSSLNTASASVMRWGRARDAHLTLNDDLNIRIGEVVTSLATYSKVPPTATHMRARVYRRPITENGFPGGEYDILIADTGPVALSDAGIVNNPSSTGYAIQVVDLPAEDHFKITSGYAYLEIFEYENSATGFSTVATAVPFRQLAETQPMRLSGYLGTTTTWANMTNASRVLCVGFAGQEYASINEIKASVKKAEAAVLPYAESLLRPIELLSIQKDPWVDWKFPGVSTPVNAINGREGLANALGKAFWAPGMMMGQEGVTFSHLTPISQMTDLTQDLLWTPATKRMLVKADTVMNDKAGMSWRKSKLIGGYFDLTANGVNYLIDDCYVDAAGQDIVYGISQQTAMTNPGLVTIRNTLVRGFRNAPAVLTNAHAINSYFDFSANDTIAGGTGTATNRKIWFDNCLLRRPGQTNHPYASPTAHSDVLQLGSVNDVRVCGSVLYYTATGSGYSEGVIGETAGVALGGLVGPANRVWFLNSIIGGGSYNVYIGLTHADADANNFFFINNIFLAGGGLAPNGLHYSRYGEFYLNNYVAGATWTNFFVWDNIAADGYPVRLTGSRLPLQANVPALANGASISMVQVGREGGTGTPPIWTWTPTNGTKLRGMFNYDKNTIGDAEVEMLVRLGRNHGVEIINPLTRELNPRYNFGSMVRNGELPSDTVAPQITNLLSKTNAENTPLSLALTANETVAWEIVGGADADDFEIVAATLRWANNGTKNFNNPTDADGNNIYSVLVRATDLVGLTDTKTIQISVTSVPVLGPLSLSEIYAS